MTVRDLFFLMIGVSISGAVHATRRSTTTQAVAWDEERLKAAQARVEPYLCFGWAGLLAWFDLYIFFRWTVGSERWQGGFYVLIPGLASASALLVLIGLVLQDAGLPRRMGRMWGARFAKALAKPKPGRSEYDLD